MPRAGHFLSPVPVAMLFALITVPGCSLTAGVNRSISAGKSSTSTSGKAADDSARTFGDPGGTPGGTAQGIEVVEDDYDSVPAPNLLGMTFGAAIQAAKAAGFARVHGTSVETCSGSRPARDHVWCQFPAPGQRGSQHRGITVILNGPSRDDRLIDEDIHGLVGMTVADAKQRLADLGFAGRLTIAKLREYDPRCAQGRVCRTDPEHQITREGANLELQINRSADAETPPP